MGEFRETSRGASRRVSFCSTNPAATASCGVLLPASAAHAASLCSAARAACYPCLRLVLHRCVTKMLCLPARPQPTCPQNAHCTACGGFERLQASLGASLRCSSCPNQYHTACLEPEQRQRPRPGSRWACPQVPTGQVASVFGWCLSVAGSRSPACALTPATRPARSAPGGSSWGGRWIRYWRCGAAAQADSIASNGQAAPSCTPSGCGRRNWSRLRQPSLGSGSDSRTLMPRPRQQGRRRWACSPARAGPSVCSSWGGPAGWAGAATSMQCNAVQCSEGQCSEGQGLQCRAAKRASLAAMPSLQLQHTTHPPTHPSATAHPCTHPPLIGGG